MYNQKYMNLAKKMAKKAAKRGEIPVGAVVVKNNNVIGKGYNLKEKKKNSLYHAEILAINQATKHMKNWRLDGCDIYVTLEPCPMCASLIHQSRISNLYYSVKNSNINNSKIISEIFNDNYINSNKLNVEFCEDLESVEIIKNFFCGKRLK